MKKYLWSLSLILLLLLASCGSGNEEAKELLKRILNLIGIPQSIVVNICQDKNKDGFCSTLELQTKVSINKINGDTLSDIWNKISNTAEGKYLLETYDPTLPLLLELQDTNSQYYTNKFTIPFSGLQVTDTEKDLSLLQAMVDAGYLTANEILPVETMTNRDKFYAVLLKDFQINLNILEEQNLSSPRAVLANLQEVAIELQDAGIEGNLTNEIDACGDDDTCIDDALEETIIINEEVTEIEIKETKTSKEMFAGKTFYAYFEENGTKFISEVVINNETTSWSYKNIVGNTKSGIETIEIDGDKLSIFHPEESNPDVYSTIAREKYISLTNTIELKFFYNRIDAEAELEGENEGNTHDEKLVKDLVSGHVTFKKDNQNSSVPSDAWIRIVPSRNKQENNYSGINCKIESNGNFGLECYVYNAEEQALRHDLTNNSETFQVVVYANSNKNRIWEEEEETYGFLGENISPSAWSEFEINLNANTNSESNNFNFSDIGSDTTALSSPNGGEKWTVGQPETIIWSTSKISGRTVNLYVLHDDPSNLHDFSSSLNNLLSNKNWYQFGTNISNTGSYTVDPQNLNGNGNAYVILISDSQNGWDISDSTITLSLK